tara:strand:+ start:944 stop:1483 length:540 start_codon:yes stop_codon:yes gene_type:complete
MLLEKYIKEVILKKYNRKINEGPYDGKTDPTSPYWFEVGDAVWLVKEKKFGRVLKQPDDCVWPSKESVFGREEGEPAGYYNQEVFFPLNDDANWARGQQRGWTKEDPTDPEAFVLWPFFDIEIFGKEVSNGKNKVEKYNQLDGVIHIKDAVNMIKEEDIKNAKDITEEEKAWLINSLKF